MPYITEERREFLDECIPIGLFNRREQIGELNYFFTKVLLDYMSNVKESYSIHNEIIGLLESIKQEWYRRSTSSYEDIKIQANGDVY
jgi:hypothetical protein